MKKAIMYFLIFVGIQMLTGGLVQLVFNVINGAGAVMDAWWLIGMTALADVVTLVCFLFWRWAEVSPGWVQTRPWGVLFWCALTAMGVIIPSSWLQELLPPLPNWAELELNQILGHRMGYFVVGLLAPLVEELVFRGAILRALLQWKSNAWVGIVISAVLFAAVHMNPAQMPHAFLMGLLLGWMYWRTGSIVPGVVFHWVNNTIAYVLFQFYPDPNMELIDLFSGNQQSVNFAVLYSLAILIPSIVQLHLRMRRADE